MKKLILTAFAAVLLPTLVLAQGTVSFGSATANQYFQFADLTKAAGVQAQLWWSPDNVAAYQSIATATTGTGAAAGYIAPAITVVTPTAGGGSAWFYVSGNPALYTGQTPNFQVTGLGNPAGIPVPTPAPTLAGWTAPITLVPVPEPSVIALAGLGLASLLIFRRRK